MLVQASLPLPLHPIVFPPMSTEYDFPKIRITESHDLIAFKIHAGSSCGVQDPPPSEPLSFHQHRAAASSGVRISSSHTLCSSSLGLRTWPSLLWDSKTLVCYETSLCVTCSCHLGVYLLGHLIVSLSLSGSSLCFVLHHATSWLKGFPLICLPQTIEFLETPPTMIRGLHNHL